MPGSVLVVCVQSSAAFSVFEHFCFSLPVLMSANFIPLILNCIIFFTKTQYYYIKQNTFMFLFSAHGGYSATNPCDLKGRLNQHIFL